MLDILTDQIERSIEKFIESLPEIEREIYASMLNELKELSLYADGTIKNSLENIKILGRVKKQMDDIVLNDAYLKNVNDFLEIYSLTEKTMNVYFGKINEDYTPKKVFAEVKNLAVDDAVEMLTENGIGANVTGPLKDLIQTNITSGGSYSSLTEQLRESLLTTPDVDGKLVKYAKTYTTDAVNTYSGTYMKMVTEDLGLKWFRYVGSLIKTSRPFCVALVRKSYIHESEFAEILKGNIDGKKVSLSGVKKETTPANFQQLRGGWQCGHQLIPTSEEAVPERAKHILKAKDSSSLLMENAKGISGDVQSQAEQIAEKYGAKATPINLKSEESILRKAADDYNGNVIEVKDAVRNTIIADKSQIGNIIADLEKTDIHFRTKIQEAGSDALGYSGTIVNIKKDGVFGEIQINTARMIYAKQDVVSAKAILGDDLWNQIRKETGLDGGLGHKYYEEWRVLIKSSKPEDLLRAERIAQKSREYYSHFY